MSQESSRIAIYLHSIYGSGVDRIMVNLSHSFIENGLKVDLVLDSTGLIHLWDWSPQMRIVNLNSGRNPVKRLSNLMRYLRREKPTSIISNGHFTNEISILAKRLSGVSTQVIVCEQNNLFLISKHSPGGIQGWAPTTAKMLYPWADRVVVPSRALAKELATLGLPSKHMQVIYNPVVRPEIWEKAKEPVDHPWFAPGEPPVILAVGRLETQKDYPTMIRAFAQVRQVKPVRLVIFGQGTQRSEIEALVHELELEKDVAFLGFVKNPYAYVAKSAMLALSSAWEALPTFVIETMALEIPVVSTNCPTGPAEILDNGKYGDIVPVGDYKAMAAAILNVLSGESKAVDPAWIEQFTSEDTTKKYLEVMGLLAK